jgi:hypothetical protein
VLNSRDPSISIGDIVRVNACLLDTGLSYNDNLIIIDITTVQHRNPLYNYILCKCWNHRNQTVYSIVSTNLRRID